MADQASGWARLGDALGGNSELEYEKGLQMGANTENALAQASERRSKAKAQMTLSEQLKAAGFKPEIADASAGALTAGAGLGDVITMAGKSQEQGFRDDAAGVTGLDFATGNRRAMGFASGLVDRYQKVGNGVDDRFDDAGVQALPGGAQEGGGSAAAIQVMRAFGMLDENGNVKPGMEAKAFDIMRSTERSVDLGGGVPGVTSANPFKGPAATAISTPQDVAGNAGAVDAGKLMPKSYAQFRSATTNADSVMGKIDDALKDTNWASAGPAAWLTRGVAGTPAFELDRIVDSIKANAGFKELSTMRHESPTGGALGNVTVEELKFLQSAIASMDTAQTPAQLTKALADVRDSYARYKAAAAEDFELAQMRAQFKSQAPVAAPVAAPAGPAGPAAPAAPAASQPVEARISTDAEYDALPPGTVFIAPDGKRRRKP